MLNVKIHKCHPEAIIPAFQSSGAVGFDFHISEDADIEPGEIRLLATGLVIEVPEDYALFIVPRSSTPKKFGLIMPHSFGVIDNDYCGAEDEIKILVKNPSKEIIKVKKGDRLAQGIFIKIAKANFTVTDFSLRDSRGGFGSTGHD